MDLGIRTLGFLEAWEFFKGEDDNSREYQEVSKRIIHGINLRFSIHDYFKGRRSIKIRDRNRLVNINGKVYPIDQFDEEIMLREKLLKRWLIDNVENKQIAMPRYKQVKKEEDDK